MKFYSFEIEDEVDGSFYFVVFFHLFEVSRTRSRSCSREEMSLKSFSTTVFFWYFTVNTPPRTSCSLRCEITGVISTGHPVPEDPDYLSKVTLRTTRERAECTRCPNSGE